MPLVTGPHISMLAEIRQKYLNSIVSPHLKLSIGSVALCKMTYNKTNFTVGSWHKQELSSYHISTLGQNNINQKDIIAEPVVI